MRDVLVAAFQLTVIWSISTITHCFCFRKWIRAESEKGRGPIVRVATRCAVVFCLFRLNQSRSHGSMKSDFPDLTQPSL